MKMKGLPQDLAERAFGHIAYLAALGHRVAGTENEAQAITYAHQRLEELGIPVVVEPYEFETFEIADDNGSGVGVLIELARYFKALEDEITCRLNFIAFGAEECGILGSRVYVESHPDDLKRCALAFNLDQVRGDSRPDIEMLGGVQGMPAEKGQSQFPVQIKNRALDGQQNNWKIIL